MEKCHNCVYYKPDRTNYCVGKCKAVTNEFEYTEFSSHCNKWRTNKTKYNMELIGDKENNAD